MPTQNGIADLIVKGAIALVTAAFFIGAYLQFQLSFWLALIAALSVYTMLLMVHALMRRSERETELVDELNSARGRGRSAADVRGYSACRPADARADVCATERSYRCCRATGTRGTRARVAALGSQASAAFPSRAGRCRRVRASHASWAIAPGR